MFVHMNGSELNSFMVIQPVVMLDEVTEQKRKLLDSRDKCLQKSKNVFTWIAQKADPA